MARLKHSFILTILFLIHGGGMKAQAQFSDVEQIRNLIFFSDFDLEKSIQVLTDIKASNLTGPLAKAYEGATEALVAKYSWYPWDKISHLKEGVKAIENAVLADENNIEIRFLRFYVENSIPSYLGYSKNIDSDKEVIMSNIANLNSLALAKEIAQFISGYMRNSGKCTEQEVILIDELLGSN